MKFTILSKEMHITEGFGRGVNRYTCIWMTDLGFKFTGFQSLHHFYRFMDLVK